MSVEIFSSSIDIGLIVRVECHVCDLLKFVCDLFMSHFNRINRSESFLFSFRVFKFLFDSLLGLLTDNHLAFADLVEPLKEIFIIIVGFAHSFVELA